MYTLHVCTHKHWIEKGFLWNPRRWFGAICSLQWRNNGRDGVSNHRRLDYLLNRLFRRRSKKTSKLRITGLCEGNPPVAGRFPSQRAGSAENVSIWWRHTVAYVQALHTSKLIIKKFWWTRSKMAEKCSRLYRQEVEKLIW